MKKIRFPFFLDNLQGLDSIRVGFLGNRFNKVKERSILILYFSIILAYSLTIIGYFGIHIYYMMSVAIVLLIAFIVSLIKNLKKRLTSSERSIFLIYIPISNILLGDVFFLVHRFSFVNVFVIYTHFMLVFFIAIVGLICNHRHIIIVGCISVAWILISLINSNEHFLWFLGLLDSFFFIVITFIIYFTNKFITISKIRLDELGSAIGNQNTHLKEDLSFKENMFNMFVHDIKIPLNRILFAVNMKTIQKEEITESSKQILLILDNILDSYKMIDSKILLKLSIEHIESIIEKATKQVNYLLKEKGISIISRYYVRSSIEVDVNLIERVMVNILTNAIKYSKVNSSIIVSVSPNEEKIRVEVIDTGEGIPSENIDTIFNKYYQSNPRYLGFVNSTGIGLTFCKLVIETHGGTIGAKSKLNVGSTIWFDLPVLSENEIICKEEISDFSRKNNDKIEDEKILIQYKKKIANLAIYQTGEIFNILKSTPYEHYPGFLKWKEEVITTSMTGNAEYFDDLKKISS